MTTILAAAGVNTSVFAQHSNQSALAAFLKSKKALFVKEICHTAD
jgi:hypothetical protein